MVTSRTESRDTNHCATQKSTIDVSICFDVLRVDSIRRENVRNYPMVLLPFIVLLNLSLHILLKMSRSICIITEE